MPTKQELQELAEFVETLPTSSSEEILVTLSKRFDWDEQELRELLESYVHHFFHTAEAMAESIRLLKHMGKDIEENFDMTPVLELNLRSSLLRMFCYASEYARRWTLPTMMDSFNSQVSDMTTEPHDEGKEDGAGSES